MFVKARNAGIRRATSITKNIPRIIRTVRHCAPGREQIRIKTIRR